MSDLTVERLFSDPPLTGTLPSSLQFSPDGERIGYLKIADDDRERTDLWQYSIARDEHSLWLNASELLESETAETAAESAAEKAARERSRSFNRGITAFSFSPDGSRVLLPVGGAGHLLDTASGAVLRFTPSNTRQTDLRFSSKGSYVTYVRAGNLYRYSLQTEEEYRLTDDGGDLVSNGMAEFIAQEEMHRFTGYWWSPDERYLAFTRVDESPVAQSYRYEIDAAGIQVIPQRYPYAGATNADVRLMLLDCSNGEARELNYKAHEDDYLARVDWLGDKLVVQRQERGQKNLTLLRIDPTDATQQTLLTEHAETWVNLHDNFKALDQERFLWTSERDGNSRLYLYDQGELRNLSDGARRINRVVQADLNTAWALGWNQSPTEQHLFRIPLAEGSLQQVSSDPGWHEATLSADGRWLLDRFTALDEPGRITLRALKAAPTQTTGNPAAIVGGEPYAIARETVDQNHPYFRYAQQHVTPELGTLSTEDGQTLHYRLTSPSGPVPAGGRPAIVFVYGGPGVQRVKNEWPPLLLQLLARHGFGVLELDNRGSANRERDFETPIYGQLGEVEVRDQVVGATHLQSLDWVNGARIGVFGHSYGGYMTIMCMAKASHIFRAGVAVAPVTDWRLYDTHYTERYLSTPERNPEGYESSGVFPHLDGLKGRLLLIHGMADDNVLYTHSTLLYRALQARGQPFEMMAYPGSKHALQERDVSIHRFNLLLDFFRKAL